jgi:cell division FtsZ-interacting protein ZapD
MTARSAATRSSNPSRKLGEQLKDEVYRQMFRLEADRPGAGLDLSIALLRAWIASDSEDGTSESREWLKKICPICLLMIEAAQQVSGTGRQCIQ